MVITVTDSDGAFGTADMTVQVNNLAPIFTGDGVTATPDVVDEGCSSIITADATDVPEDVLSLRYAFGCEGDGTFGPEQPENSTTCEFADGPAVITVGVLVSDQDGGETFDSVNVTVNSVNPVITGVTANPSLASTGLRNK